MSGDVSALDLLIDDSRAYAAAAQDTLTAYQGHDANTYTLKVRRVGEASTLLSGSWALAKDNAYTAVVWGRETALRLHTLPESEKIDDVSAGNSKLRVFNATTDSGTLDVYLTATDTDIAETLPTHPSNGSGAIGGWRDVSTGSYRLRVTGSGDPNDLRLDIPSIALKERGYATLVLTAGPGGVLVHGTLLEQGGAATALKSTKARLRLVASVGAAGTVAVSLAGRTRVGGLRSPSVGPYALVEAGTADLALRVNGVQVAASRPTLAAGGDYTLLAMGTVSSTADSAQIRLLTDDNRLPSASNRVKLRLVNGVASAPPVTLSIDFSALAIDVPAGTASTYATLNFNSSVRVDVTAAGAASELYTTSDVNLQAQSVYSVYLLDGNAAATGVIRKER